MRPTILDLCAGSGSWSQPYADDGYEVIRVDMPDDIRLREFDKAKVHGILAAPPCTVFAGSGARWPRTDEDLIEGMSVVDACLRAVVIYRPTWWALENPVGKLRRYLGPSCWAFDPCDYGDPYTKRTQLWGSFTVPMHRPCVPSEGSKFHRLAPSDDRASLRSVTPPGFAKAFFEANP